MPGLLSHSVARIVQALLVAKGLGTDPALRPLQAWPVYAGSEPDVPDNLLVVSRTAGRLSGFIQIDGEAVVHPGFQVMVRGTSRDEAEVKAGVIADALDKNVRADTVVLDGSTYCIASVTRTSDIAGFGRQADARRFFCTVNAVVSLRRL